MVKQGSNNIDGQLKENKSSNEQKKIQELGTKIDEVNTQSLAIKEERISQLEMRIEELRNENNALMKRNEQSVLY